jgi:PGF-CTERM protein
MKSITKLMVVAMLLVAALVVAPATAARTVGDGGNVFIGEEDLSFTAPPSETVTQWVHYSDPTAGTIDKTLTATGGVIDELNKGIPTGSYYVFTDAASADPANRTTAAGYVNVQEPRATLDVVIDDATRKDSVNGKSVTKNTVLAFKLGNNVDTAVSAGINIDLTLPGGGVTNTFGGPADNLKLIASGTTQYVSPISLTNAEAGTYTAVAKWAKATDFYGKGFDSNSVTFDVATKELAITSNKDSLVRGNSFTVTVAGESNTVYYLYVRDAGVPSNWNYPWMIPQNGVDFTTNIPARFVPNIPGNAMANVTTTAAGTRTVQFNTDNSVKDQSFTIRVQDVTDENKYDDVKVRIEAGSVTITTSGTGTYYIGEEITLSGTNTEADMVYLFMTGPNLASSGVKLETPSQRVKTGDPNNFTTTDVEADDTWSKKWNTAGLPLDAGSYTIYAVSADVEKDDLSDAKYATASISLRSGFITATVSGATVAKGDKLIISGTAQGNPDNVRVWIFGKNYYGTPNSRALNAESVPVESDGTFEHELDSSATKDLAGGQYFVVVQHPMGDNFGVDPNDPAPGWINGPFGSGITAVELTNLQAPNAASALINALDSPNIPDTYVKLTFVVEEAVISIDPIGTKEAGSKFTITGTTNLAVGDTLIVDVTSAAFQPGEKTEASAFSGFGGSTIVEKGDGTNTWSFEVDATGFKPDEYIVKVEAIEAGKTATALFDMVEATETPPAEVTTAPEGEVTTAPPEGETTTAEPTTPPTPGFGALVALAGLGAVAFLVLRRK